MKKDGMRLGQQIQNASSVEILQGYVVGTQFFDK